MIKLELSIFKPTHVPSLNMYTVCTACILCTIACKLWQGWDVLYAELLEKSWKEKMDEWGKRPKGEGCV